MYCTQCQRSIKGRAYFEIIHHRTQGAVRAGLVCSTACLLRWTLAYSGLLIRRGLQGVQAAILRALPSPKK
jgi:hypothetical protein